MLLASFASALTVVSWPVTPSVSVRFLGTGIPDFVLDKPRMQAGIVVDAEGERWLLDAGAGVLARLIDYRIAPDSLTNIFLSHLHYDHCIDLDSILLSWFMGGPVIGSPDRMRSRAPLALWGPDGTEKMLTGLYDVAYGEDGRGRVLLKQPLLRRTRNRDAGAVKTAKVEASFLQVKHAGMDCWAIRLRTSRGVIVYSGDIGAPLGKTYEDQAGFAEWAQGADMLILDTLHLTPEVLAKIVSTAAPKTVVFSHMAERVIPLFPGSDVKRAAELARKPGVKVVVAAEGMSLAL
jgi:ribonuclease BN (tRNA processing enzyme)